MASDPKAPDPQTGLFGDMPPVRDMHVVEAHTRVRADGTEVFVAEYLRWNRGRRATGPRRRRTTVREEAEEQLGLFGD